MRTALAAALALALASAPAAATGDVPGWVRPGSLACDVARFECSRTDPAAWTPVTVGEADGHGGRYVRSGRRTYLMLDGSDVRAGAERPTTMR